MPLPVVPLDSSNERQHRTVIATAVNELIKVRPPNDRTPEEAEAGVTPLNPAYASLPRIDLRRYGLDASATDETNRRAVERAVAVAAVLGAAVLVAPPGTFFVDATTTIDANNVIIEGQGQNVTLWKFNPASSDVCFHFVKSGTSIVRSGMRLCGFLSTNSTTKEAIRIEDGRQCVVERVAINSGNWPGSGSIGLHTFGRDFLHFSHCDIECARPWLISVNPNLSGVNEITLDMTKVVQVQFATTETTGKCVEIEDGAIMYSTEFDTCDFAGGKYGIFWDDTTSARDSLHLGVRNSRFEQADDATGFDIYIASTANNLANLHLEKVNGSGGRGFLYGRNLERISLFNSILPGGSGITNFDITFVSSTALELVATLVQAGSTNTFTNGVAVVEAPFGTAANAVSPTALYRYNELALVSRRARREDGVLSFHYKGTIADDAQINLPVLSSGGADVCHLRIAMGSSTGPVLEGGNLLWRPGTVATAGVTANVVTTNTDTKLCVIDNTNALSVINRLGGTMDIVLDAVWSD